MQTNHPPKRTAPGAAATGVKFLITAASLTAVVGGWAAFSLKQPAASTQTATNVIILPPLPTLVTESRRTVQVVQGAQPSANSQASNPEPAAPVLRSVTIPQPQPSDNTAPPPPVTNTRSSR